MYMIIKASRKFTNSIYPRKEITKTGFHSWRFNQSGEKGSPDSLETYNIIKLMQKRWRPVLKSEFIFRRINIQDLLCFHNFSVYHYNLQDKQNYIITCSAEKERYSRCRARGHKTDARCCPQGGVGHD